MTISIETLEVIEQCAREAADSCGGPAKYAMQQFVASLSGQIAYLYKIKAAEDADEQ